MPSGHANLDGFKYIKEVGSVTAEQYAEKFGLDLNSARGWLSKWKTKGYLEFTPPRGYSGHKPQGRPSGGEYSINYWHLEEE